jgi:threonine dehydratase
MATVLRSIPLAAIRAARNRIAGAALRTPLLRLDLGDAPAEIYLKLENLQPIGSFKLRGAGNAMALASPEQLRDGVATASAGNMAQGVAWNARRLGIPCRVIVPEDAPRIKLEAVARLGAEAVKVPYDTWWQAMEQHGLPEVPGFFIHPVADPGVVAGNGTIGLEILEDLPDVDAVVVPFGGGGLSCGIASAFRFLKPDVRIYACEVETAAPLAAALAAGTPVEIDHQRSFVDGMGGKTVLPEMWPLVRQLIPESLVVPLRDVADAIGLLAAHSHVVAEGAGAAPVAAALAGKTRGGKVVCVVSGGNIDIHKLAKILSGEVPEP